MSEQPHPAGAQCVVTWMPPAAPGFRNHNATGDVVTVTGIAKLGRELNGMNGVSPEWLTWLWQEVGWCDGCHGHVMHPVRWLRPLEDPDSDNEEVDVALSDMVTILERSGF